MLSQLFLVARAHRHRVEHRVHGDAGQPLLLVERDAKLAVGLKQFRVDLVERSDWLRRLGCRVVARGLIIDWRVYDVRPVRLGHCLPATERFQAPVEQPLRLTLLCRDEAHGFFGQPRRKRFRLDVGDEPVLILAIDQLVDGRTHACSCSCVMKSLRTRNGHTPAADVHHERVARPVIVPRILPRPHTLPETARRSHGWRNCGCEV